MRLGLGKRRAYVIKMIAVYILLITGMIVVAIPGLYMVSTSLKPRWATGTSQLIPNPIVWENYPNAFKTHPFARFLSNSVKLAFWNIVGVTLTSAMAAYAFARLEWRGRDQLFLIVLATLMLPGQVTMIPKFILFKELNWLDTYLPLTVPAFFGGGAFNIFLLRQFFKTISHELEDAARIDGCGRWGILWRIMLPLSKPALITVALYTFIGVWMDFFGPLIYLYDKLKFPVALGLRLFQGRTYTDWGPMMAATVISTLPVLIVYYYGQRSFVQSAFVFTGIKG